MEQHPGGIKLTERNEFIVVGQACCKLPSLRIPDDLAANIALDHLESLEDKEWLLSDVKAAAIRPTIMRLTDRYMIWRGQLSAGIPQEAWDDESNQVWELYQTSLKLLGGIATRLGVPERTIWPPL